MEDRMNLHSQQKCQFKGHLVNNMGDAERSKLFVIKLLSEVRSHKIPVVQVDEVSNLAVWVLSASPHASRNELLKVEVNGVVGIFREGIQVLL
jgi:hypothetical protein